MPQGPRETGGDTEETIIKKARHEGGPPSPYALAVTHTGAECATGLCHQPGQKTTAATGTVAAGFAAPSSCEFG